MAPSIQDDANETQIPTPISTTKFIQRLLETKFGTQLMLLPDLSTFTQSTTSQPASANVSDEHTLQLAQIHLHIYKIDGIRSVSKKDTWNLSAALKEIRVIQGAFPAVAHDDTALLSMAATFHIVCSVDDEMENLDPPIARKAIRDAFQILDDRNSAALASQSLATEKSRNLIKLSNDRWSDRRPLKSLHQRLGSSAFETAAQVGEMVPALLGTYLIHLAHLLPASTYNAIRNGTHSFCTGLRDELEYRDPSMIDLVTVEAYSHIRTRTIGLSAFFNILGGSLCPDSPTADGRSIQELKRLVSQVAELQNNILGLRKDLLEKERFNIIIVRSHVMRTGSWDERMGESLRHFVRMHNEKVKDAVECWENIVKGEVDNGTRRFVDAVLGFVVRHFLWAEKSKRYQS
jgi:hypothetical protein